MPPKSQKPSKGAKGDLTNDSVRQPSGKGDKINGKSAAQASNVSACDAAKGPSKMSKQEERALRQQEQDAMLMIPDESSEDEIAAGRSGSDPAKSHVDSFGNTLTKNAVAKAKEDAKMDVLRAEARARREAKAQREAESLVAGSEAPSAGEHVFTKAKTAVTVEDVRLKLASGAKLSHKESKLLQRAESDAIEEAERRREEAEGLSSFSISYHGGGGTVSAVDIVASGLTITAPSKSLLIDASLCLLQGRRYGLMGPNGKGKTTLLKFLAARRLPIPDGIDVLMVQQEVLASEDSVVNQVLAFDVVRARLIAEEQGLLRDFELQETISEPTSMWTTEVWAEKLARYADVGRQLEAMGADAAESSVRRILTGLGFTEEMQDGPSSILSGGWRMRVALASALFLEPKLLCLDEPTNHLDLNAVLWLENYLSSHWEGKTIIVVSHDASFLGEICTDIIHLDACKLNYYKGSYWEFASLHDQIEAKKLRDYNEEQKVVAEIKKSGIRADKIEKRALQKLNKSVLTERPSEYRVSFHLQSPDEQGPAIELRDVSFSFPSTKRTLFSHLTAKIDTYSRVSIVGPNGVSSNLMLRLNRDLIKIYF